MGKTASIAGITVAIAHDYLTQKGGAERVALSLSRAFGNAPIFTALYQPVSTFEAFSQLDVRSTLAPVGLASGDARKLLPALPFIWARTRIDDFDLVICSSSGWSHGVNTTAPKLVYCHSPARWLYQPKDYFSRGTVRQAFRPVAGVLKRWDRAHAACANAYVANSSVVAERIRRTYGREARVIHPPMSLPLTETRRQSDGDYVLTVARGRGYKATKVVIDACRRLGLTLHVVGGPLEPDSAGVRFLGQVTDEELDRQYCSARVLVAVGREDFGLTPVEAHARGVPTVLLRSGGYIDTGIEGVNTIFVDSTSAEAVSAGIAASLAVKWKRQALIASSVRFHETSFAEAMRTAAVEAVRGKSQTSSSSRGVGL